MEISPTRNLYQWISLDLVGLRISEKIILKSLRNCSIKSSFRNELNDPMILYRNIKFDFKIKYKRIHVFLEMYTIESNTGVITLLIIYKMINLSPFGIGFVPTYDCDS